MEEKGERIMSEMYEAAISVYLTRGGKVFLAPQYDIVWDKDRSEGGAVPDFVALDYGPKEIIIVEVTASGGVNSLASKINQRERRWYKPVIRKLHRLRIFDADWSIRTIAFIQNLAIPEMKRKLTEPASDVTLLPLEDHIHSWCYHARRINEDLLGSGSGVSVRTFVEDKLQEIGGQSNAGSNGPTARERGA